MPNIGKSGSGDDFINWFAPYAQLLCSMPNFWEAFFVAQNKLARLCVSQIILWRLISFFTSPSACTHCRPSGKPLGLQACTHTFEGKKRKKNATTKEGGGSMKGIGGLYKKLEIPTLPPKSPRSGVTFHFTLKTEVKIWAIKFFNETHL